MHHIYHTEGIILGSRNFKEAGKYYHIFTRDLGLVYAEAEGVRKITSKLRYVLQDYSYIKLDLIQRKNIWRITTASKTNELEAINQEFFKLKILANLSKLLIRLLPEQEKNTNLFQDFLNGLFVLNNNSDRQELQNIEIIMVLRALYNLGYIDGEESFSALIKSPFEDSNILSGIAKNKKEVLLEINKALRETQL
ncbi:MAG: DNA repair protein RecO [Candidatus Paceibacterota bacterium]